MNNEKIDLAMPNPAEDGVAHINTHVVGVTELGKILSPPYQNRNKQLITHPILGQFRTVENVWHYLNSGGGERFRHMNLRMARLLVKNCKNYRCSHFKEMLIDAQVLQLRNNSKHERMVAESTLPFDHYFLRGPDQIPTRPNYSHLYIEALNEVREIMQGKREHHFVRYQDLKFEPWGYKGDT